MTKLHRKPPKILGISRPTNYACIGCLDCHNCVACYYSYKLYKSVSSSFSKRSVGLVHSKYCELPTA